MSSLPPIVVDQQDRSEVVRQAIIGAVRRLMTLHRITPEYPYVCVLGRVRWPDSTPRLSVKETHSIITHVDLLFRFGRRDYQSPLRVNEAAAMWGVDAQYVDEDGFEINAFNAYGNGSVTIVDNLVTMLPHVLQGVISDEQITVLASCVSTATDYVLRK